MTGSPRLAVIGGGLAGCLLAWRVVRDHPRWQVELFTGRDGTGCATDMSGGLVRGFETNPVASALATASLVELRGDSRLRAWSGYQEIGSAYVCAEDQPAGAVQRLVARMARQLPGSARIVDVDRLRRAGLAGIPRPAACVLETHSGYFSPSGLRDGVLDDLGQRGHVRPEPVTRIVPCDGGALRCESPSGTHHFDRVVVAAGRWTAQLLRDSGLDSTGFRTKQIQYGVYRAVGRMPGTFIDDTSGLYGRRFAHRDEVLLGVPSQRWEPDPDRCAPAEPLQRRAERLAAERLPELRLGPLLRIVAGADCYHDPPILALRTSPDELPGLYTFTGGSGGAAKYALAASTAAAGQLDGIRVDASSLAINVTGGAS
jgi:glycine/D-amino acid oxidase-like deaminating enzyme